MLRFSTMMPLICLSVLSPAHPSHQKVGVGIAGFFVAKPPEHPGRCFHLRPSTDYDGLFMERVNTADDTNYQATNGLREAIADQKSAMKGGRVASERHRAARMPNNRRTVPSPEAHVDHRPPQTIKTLVETWLKVHGWGVDDVRSIILETNVSVDTFVNNDQCNQWRAFHQQHANCNW